MTAIKEGDTVRVVKFDDEGYTGTIYVGEGDPRGRVGVVSQILGNAIVVDFDLPNAPFLPQFFYESELEVLDETR